jgi:hypothetical protein
MNFYFALVLLSSWVKPDDLLANRPLSFLSVILTSLLPESSSM